MARRLGCASFNRRATFGRSDPVAASQFASGMAVWRLDLGPCMGGGGFNKAALEKLRSGRLRRSYGGPSIRRIRVMLGTTIFDACLDAGLYFHPYLLEPIVLADPWSVESACEARSAHRRVPLDAEG